MSRRVSLPGADELFRTTGSEEVVSEHGVLRAVPAVAPAPQPPPGASAGVRTTSRVRSPRAGDRQGTGRERHEEKITVYLSPDELIDLERARLALRQDHGLAVDRGRIVREAVAVLLADLEAKGEGSTLVRRLRAH